MTMSELAQLMNGLNADLEKYSSLRADRERYRNDNYIALLSIEQLDKAAHQIEEVEAVYKRVIPKLEKLAKAGEGKQIYEERVKLLKSEREKWMYLRYKSLVLKAPNVTRLSHVKKAAQIRSNDIQKIEKDLWQVAGMFKDLDMLVENQGQEIERMEEKGEQVKDDAEKGVVYTEVAVKNARAARKKKWKCFGIGVAIFIGAGIVVAVVLAGKKVI